jgi:integrase
MTKLRKCPVAEMPELDGPFTDGWIKALPVPDKEVQYYERLYRGLSLALYLGLSGAKSWRVLYYDKGKPRSKTLDASYPELSIAAARKAAKEFDQDKAVASSEAGTFEKVSSDWLTDYVDRRKLRSGKEMRRHLATYILPMWGNRPIYDIGRKDIDELLRSIERGARRRRNSDHAGAPQADAVLATIGSIMKWYMQRDEKYTCPLVYGLRLRRDTRKPEERARSRILSDDETKLLWAATEGLGSFGAMVRLLLLTGQRLARVSAMKWSEIDNGVWRLPREPGEKGNAGSITLAPLALRVLEAQPRISDYVFPGRLHQTIRGECAYQKGKLDRMLPADFPAWNLHDLRRSFRSLLARLGVPDHVAELLMGHAVRGVQQAAAVQWVYNRHTYDKEKARALLKLAGHIERLLKPENNVVPLRR